MVSFSSSRYSSDNSYSSLFAQNNDQISRINNNIQNILNSSNDVNTAINTYSYNLNSITPSVQVNTDRNIIGARVYDGLSRIKELIENGINDSSITNIDVNIDMAQASYYLGTTETATDAHYSSYENVPTGSFQVYTPPQLSDTELQDLVKSNAKLGALVGGNQVLYNAILDGSATIYNQEDSQVLLGTAADWKQGSMGGTMWDKTQIDQKAVQQITEEGKQIFASSIGNIHFAVAY